MSAHRTVSLFVSALFLVTAGCSPDSQEIGNPTATLGSWATPGPLVPPANKIPFNSPLFISACSLGCGSGSGGADVNCGVLDIAVNANIEISFTHPIDLATVNAQTMRIAEVVSGELASGSYVLDPIDPRTVIFRPAVDVGASGELLFGLRRDVAYEVILPGEAHPDLGPFVQDIYGQKNQSRMHCLVTTSLGVSDFVPGPPTVQMFVDLVDASGNIVPDQPAQGAVDVSTTTDIQLVFDDVMIPGMLHDESTGFSPSVGVSVDQDGDPGTVNDRVEVPGLFSFALDLNALETHLVFSPTDALPTAGPAPRRIVVEFALLPTDAVGHPLANGVPVIFTPDDRLLTLTSLEETFTDQVNQDATRSGAEWGSDQLVWGIGGGAGRLGDLFVRAGEELVLSTEGQSFPLADTPRDLLDNTVPGVDYDPLVPATWPTINVTDGNFEFSSVLVEAGGVLVLEGSNPGRVFARGELVLDGVLDLSGETPEPHISNTGGDHYQGQNGEHWMESLDGGLGGAGGPAAGDGGQGADRMDVTGFAGPLMKNMGGVYNPGAVNDGAKGEGVGGDTATGGKGGKHYPDTLPEHPGLANANFGDAEISVLDPADIHHQNPKGCTIGMVAGPGGGGAYALEGGPGVPHSDFAPVWPGLLPNTPADTPGGSNAALRLEPPGTVPPVLPPVRHLEWVHGNLRGGAGGGGGGTSIYGSKPNSSPSPACNAGTSGTSLLFPFFDHSAASGGGGGGAVQLVAGAKLAILGTIDCGGGGGGSATGNNLPLQTSCMYSGSDANTYTPDCEENAAPGGGGSGGAIKLQSKVVEFAPLAERFSVPGGDGGFGVGGSLGGDGSPGLVRIEHSGYVDDNTDSAIFAPLVSPYYPTGGPPGFNVPYLSAAILSLGNWGAQDYRPASYSGAQSCWMKPDIDFWAFQPEEDDPAAPTDPLAMGWNLKVLYSTPGGTEEFWYRGIDTNPANPLVGTDFETYLGNQLNHDEPTPDSGALLAVRFQGVRARYMDDPCHASLYPDDGEIVPGSLTPWVSHPAELNAFGVEVNRIRFCVIFERRMIATDPIFRNVLGVSDLSVSVQPY